MARTLLALLVPEAEPLVASLRDRYDPAARRALGAHITVTYPFIDSDHLSPGVVARLREILVALPAPRFELHDVRTFSSVVWLAPSPTAAIEAISSAVDSAFPARPQAGHAYPSFTAHLTAAREVRGALKAALAEELRGNVAALGPARCVCRSVALLASVHGRWNLHSAYPLEGRAAELRSP